jgi:hypothetical protein
MDQVREALGAAHNIERPIRDFYYTPIRFASKQQNSRFSSAGIEEANADGILLGVDDLARELRKAGDRLVDWVVGRASIRQRQ